MIDGSTLQHGAPDRKPIPVVVINSDNIKVVGGGAPIPTPLPIDGGNPNPVTIDGGNPNPVVTTVSNVVAVSGNGVTEVPVSTPSPIQVEGPGSGPVEVTGPGGIPNFPIEGGNLVPVDVTASSPIPVDLAAQTGGPVSIVQSAILTTDPANTVPTDVSIVSQAAPVNIQGVVGGNAVAVDNGAAPFVVEGNPTGGKLPIEGGNSNPVVITESAPITVTDDCVRAVISDITSNIFLNSTAVRNANMWGGLDTYFESISAWVRWVATPVGTPGTFRGVIYGRGASGEFPSIAREFKYPDDFHCFAALGASFCNYYQLDTGLFKGGIFDLIAYTLYDFQGPWDGSNNLSIQIGFAGIGWQNCPTMV